jgi:hypothetical protein
MRRLNYYNVCKQTIKSQDLKQGIPAGHLHNISLNLEYETNTIHCHWPIVLLFAGRVGAGARKEASTGY